METIDIKIGDAVYSVFIAKTEDEKEKGLMGVETLPENQGMLFDYTDDPQTEISFWMKDTLIPLDIVFINNQGVVTAVTQGEPMSEEPLICITNEDELIFYVLEVNAGSDIKEGDRFEISQDEVSALGLVDENGHPIEDDFEGVEDVSDEEIKMFILNSEGKPVHEIEAGVRLFSRIHTRELIRLAKHANKTKDDKDYKKVGKKLFKILDIQDNQAPEYVDSPENKIEKKENA